MNLNQSFYSLSIEETYQSLNASGEGLSQKAVRRRREKFGRNQLEKQQQKSLLGILLSQLNNPVIYLLAAAVIVSIVFNDIPESIAIIIVIVLNAFIGFWMEYRAQTSLNALKKMDPLMASVIRNARLRRTRAEDLVPGDLVTLEAGDLVPADARIVSASELKVDESPLTGESVPVPKQAEKLPEDTQLGDRTNMLYKGTALSTGKAKAVVTATGMDTEIGGISSMVIGADSDKIPLNKKLGKLARRLIWVIIGLSAMFLLFGWLAGKEIYLLLQTSIAWTVAAIPEGLPIVASISLARGMLRLARQNVLVRRLAAVETLGETTVILTDKTGTLTKNQLTLQTITLTDGEIEVEQDPDYKQAEGFEHFYKIAVLCNDATRENGHYQGDPLDVALLEFTNRQDEKKHLELQKLSRINEDPFDSDSMFMGTIHRMDGACYIAAKGATAAILEKCTHFLDRGKMKKITPEFQKEWIEKDKQQSANGLKVIGFAFNATAPEDPEELEKKEDIVEDLVFVGLGGFIDPVRPEIVDAVDVCHQAGINVVMVTGDHPETAMNIARKVHLLDNGKDLIIHGKDLDDFPQITDARIFARVDPSQKLDIVNHFKEKGEIVGMTGDGVNDAPALKKADIGIAMGKRGTQVAQEVADMVLKDDAFPSIIRAIEQGRIIFDNIKKFIIYQLSYHLSEIIIIAAISFTMFRLPLLPLQLLFLNLLSDVFPALALGVGKGGKNIMNKRPKDPDEPIITRRDWFITGLYGTVISVYVIAAYLFAHLVMQLPSEICNNIAFFSLAFGQLFHVLDMREADEPVLKNQVTRNRYIWLALGFCTAVLMAGYFIPVLSRALAFQKLSPEVWLVILVTSLLPLITNQVVKKTWKL
jgi:Ca2+-transporting ATPase